MGGGYDMQGTVFGGWLQETYQEAVALLAYTGRAYGTYVDNVRQPNNERSGLYGMTLYRSAGTSRVMLDGACGLESMLTIAKTIGLTVRRISNRRGHLTGLLVTQATPTVTVHRSRYLRDTIADGDVTYHDTDSETIACDDVTDAVHAITRAGCLEYSASEFQRHGWYSAEDYTTDYGTGEMCAVSAHPDGFNVRQLQDIYAAVSRA